MNTLDDVRQHPLAPLFRATFDNADAAYALEIPNFTDWRKSFERKREDRDEGLFCLPRTDENSARPTFRYAHFVEFRLAKELTNFGTKETAAAIVESLLHRMRQAADGKLRKMSKEVRDAISSERVDAKLSDKEKFFSWTVKYPWLALDSEFLDRSEVRLKDPLMLVVGPGVVAGGPLIYKMYTASGTSKAYELLDGLTERWRSLTDEQSPAVRSSITVDLTNLCADMESRLLTRLRLQELQGHTPSLGQGLIG